MRIGILRTDAVSPDLSARHGDYPDVFRALLGDPAARPPYLEAPDFAAFDVRDGGLPAAGECDAYLITGSRHSVYDPLPWIEPLCDFLREALAARRRVVGVCFGHQLLARCLGGEAGPAPEGWCVGVHRARVLERQCFMPAPATHFDLLVSHQDQVLKLPPGARLFAAAARCPIAGFVVGDALAIQGHPEFTPGYAGDLMDVRREQLGEDVYRDGKASLAQPTDAPLVARWMLEFMAGGGP